MASKKRNMKLKGRLKSYTQTSLYLGFLLVAVNLLVYILDVPSGLVLTCFTLFYFGITVLLQLYNKPIIMNELVSFATQYGQIQKVLLRELELPYAMLDEEGRIIWTNARFEEVVHKEKGYRKSITSLFPSITREKLPDEEDEVSFPIAFEDRNYEVRMRKISMREMAQNSERLVWTAEEVDAQLHRIMNTIYQMSVEAAEEYGLGYNLVAGANIAGFKRVAEAMMEQGVF